LIAYREYKAGDRSAAEHCHPLMQGEPRIPVCAGGSKSEGQWRREFANGGTAMIGGKPVRVAGLPIHGPAQPDVEVGINEVWKMFSLDKLLIFEDLRGLLDELQSYSRDPDVGLRTIGGLGPKGLDARSGFIAHPGLKNL
jgi:hypothetical protein